MSKEGENFNRLALWFFFISLAVCTIGYKCSEMSEYKKVRVTTCGHVIDKIMDGTHNVDSEGYHVYTDHRVIVYEDEKKNRYTYQFGFDEKEEFYKVRLGEVFCASHIEEIKIK